MQILISKKKKNYIQYIEKQKRGGNCTRLHMAPSMLGHHLVHVSVIL